MLMACSAQKVCLVCPLAFHCPTRANMVLVFVFAVIVFDKQPTTLIYHPKDVVGRVDTFNEQYFVLGNSGLEAINPENPDFLPTEHYINGCIAAYSYFDDLVPQIKINIRLQSESDESFPQKVEDAANKIFVGAWPDVVYAVTQAHGTVDGAIQLAFAMQRTDPVNNSSQLEGAILSDATENLGISTTGQGNKTIDYFSAKLLPFGEKNLLFRYDRPIGSGEYQGVSIPGSGNSISDYIPN